LRILKISFFIIFFALFYYFLFDLKTSDLPAFIVSLFALIVASETFLLKSGIYIRGSFSKSWGSSGNDSYISNITLENLKDRAIVIFNIELKIGNNYYIEIENFEKKPLIIKPFEIYQQSFEPILFYYFNMKRVDISKLLNDIKIKKTIVLTTPDGMYHVKESIQLKNSLIKFFNNYCTALIKPYRIFYDGHSYGDNVKFLIDFDGKHTIAIEKNDTRLKKFVNFQLTEAALENREMLEKFLFEKKAEGKISFDSLNVYDFQSKVKVASDRYDNKIEAKYYGKFRYFFLCKLSSIYQNLKTKYQRSKIKKTQ